MADKTDELVLKWRLLLKKIEDKILPSVTDSFNLSEADLNSLSKRQLASPRIIQARSNGLFYMEYNAKIICLSTLPPPDNTDRLELNLTNYNCLVLQSRANFNQITEDMKEIRTFETNVPQLIAAQIELEKKSKQNQINICGAFLQNWEAESTHRIILSKTNEARTICIYAGPNQFVPFQGEKDCRQLILHLQLHHLLQTAKPFLTGFKKQFQERIGSSLGAFYTQEQEKVNKLRSERIRQLTDSKMLQRYDLVQIKSLMSMWESKLKRGVTYTHVYIKQVLIPIQLTPKSVRLTLADCPPQECTFVKCDSNQQFLIYSLNSTRSFPDRPLLMHLLATTNTSEVHYEGTVPSVSSGAFTHQVVLMAQNGDACKVYLELIRNARPAYADLSKYTQNILLKHIPNIPTKFRNTLHVDYTPDNFPIISHLLLGTPQKLTKKSYETIFLKLVGFIQSEENLSQNSATKHPSRYSFYLARLKRQMSIGAHETIPLQQYYLERHERGHHAANRSRLSLPSSNFKNLKHDLSFYSLLYRDKVTQFFLRFLQFSKSEETFPIRYLSVLVPIVDKLYSIVEHSSVDTSEHFYFVLGFLQFFYPYSSLSTLQTDMHLLREAVSQTLPHLNYYLNRIHIGLENVIAKYLLHFFANSLSEELTFRIWDLLIISPDRRLHVMHTLLIYLETTNLLPIIPISQFINSVSSNSFLFNPVYHTKYSEIIQAQHGKWKKRRKLIARLGNPNNLPRAQLKSYLPQEKHIRRFLGQSSSCSKGLSNISFEEKHMAPNAKHGLKEYTLQKLHYALPTARHMGHTVTHILLFIHSVNILENIAATQLRILSIGVPQDILLPSRRCFLNTPIKLVSFDKGNSTNITFSVLSKEGKVDLQGTLDIAAFHKNAAYKTQVSLHPSKQELMSNRGESYLHLTICLKSQDQLYPEKSGTNPVIPLLLGYDVTPESNPCLEAVAELKRKIEKMKVAVDEFEANRYSCLQIAELRESVVEHARCSQVTLEEFKMIFKTLFYDQEAILLDCLKYFEGFADEGLQHVILSEFLFLLIVMADLSLKKKLTYLYMVLVHYQNAYSTMLTPETYHSFFTLLHNSQCVLSACPSTRRFATILEADCLHKGTKYSVRNIFQDQAYIFSLLFNHSAVVLGPPHVLTVLKAVLPVNFTQPTLRFEVVYEFDQKILVWAAVVDSKSFTILDRGVKFLGNHMKYPSMPYLTSTQEVLSYCQNVIPLGSSKGVSYDDFSAEVYDNCLARCILSWSAEPSQSLTDAIVAEVVQEMKAGSTASKEYSSWALCRYENCVERWWKCEIVEGSENAYSVRFEHDPLQLYSVPKIEVISMEETLL